MFRSLFNTQGGVARTLRLFAIAYIALLCAAAVLSLVLSATGIWPWLTLEIAGWGYTFPAGHVVQIASAGLGVALLLYLPSAIRVSQLEHAHRKFSMRMEDVAHAYQISHRADREGVFNLSSEFDAVRERMTYLRQHPDLSRLEPDVLEAAAQMSHVSRDLATVYSDENVDRAKAVLKQRQTEVSELQERINHAKSLTDELRRWTTQVSVEESVADQQIEQLCKDLADLLPELNDTPASGIARATTKTEGSKVVSIPAVLAGLGNAAE
ncbi:hypothetical protein ATO10_00580 [Actibacterium atlanticum]|uniref:DNA repair protein n=1 Tax=Actibacterium atlanticum TaxID=1461693 RepID=A0A058ZQX3_9RHOB|nr:DNA repair protein [Actibacterium atlanticum]KCV83211.1 hypothetical protein ATO10_00580 [Actibacterium atlanticum]